MKCTVASSRNPRNANRFLLANDGDHSPISRRYFPYDARSEMTRFWKGGSAVASALLVACLFAGTPALAQDATIPPGTDSAEGVVYELYDMCTFDAGTLPDWDAMRALFLPQATVVLRNTRTSNTIFSMDGFIEDWHRFIARDNVEERGFSEKIVRMSTTVLGDIAHIMVLYEASFPDWDRPPQPGVDFIQLIKNDGRWWIVSIANEVPAPNWPLPEALRGGGS